jgi:mono/diheme cytochrome c family protein
VALTGGGAGPVGPARAGPHILLRNRRTSPEDELTEVPEHLLARSRERRAALGLGGGDDAGGGGGGDAPSAAAPATTDRAEASVPAAAAAAPAAPVVVEAPPPPAHVQAAIDRPKIPWWAASVLALLPVWAIVYAGTLSEADTGEETVLARGGEIYASACATCHGGTGAGGVGPQLSGGAVVENFPDRADQLRWVWGGSDGWPADTYGAREVTSVGGMPAFNTLDPDDLLAVVRYTREVLSGEEISEEEGEELDEDERLFILPDDMDDLGDMPIDAVEYYFGEPATADQYTVEDGEVFVRGAEFSAPSPD